MVERLESGGTVRMAVLGGSVSAGTSMRVRPDQSGLFHRKFQRWLESRFPGANISHTNAAMPAVPPAYMEQCLLLHVPADVDLVLMESAANMCALHDCPTGMLSVERMLRQLLNLERRPAIIFVHAYPFWLMDGTPKSWLQRKKRPGGFKKVRRGSTGLPILDQSDLAFEFHRQWGHGTNEHMIDELAKYCASHGV